MISVQQAFAFISGHIPAMNFIRIALSEALGHVLAEDIFSPIDMPPFPQSAMDGYALCLHQSNDYRLIGEIKAGDKGLYHLSPGEAVRIFTGGVVPDGANAVAQQEIAERTAEGIRLQKEVIDGSNIRPQGEQVQRGAIALKQGTRLNPGTIGYLFSLGITEVFVFEKPRVHIVTTGNELVPPGAPLPHGKIYDSNGPMLVSALQQEHITPAVSTVPDEYEATVSLFRELLSRTDMLLITGGISVGDYDFVGKALAEAGVQSLFYKVKQKPGKPFYFGKSGKTSVFALPGNPAAALTCFYVYVKYALNCTSDLRVLPDMLHLQLTDSFTKKAGLTHFLKAQYNGSHVRILPAQSSAMLSAFAEANCLVVASETQETWSGGDRVDVLLLGPA